MKETPEEIEERVRTETLRYLWNQIPPVDSMKEKGYQSKIVAVFEQYSDRHGIALEE